jgi:hypothetical protein
VTAVGRSRGLAGDKIVSFMDLSVQWVEDGCEQCMVGLVGIGHRVKTVSFLHRWWGMRVSG